MFRTERTRPRRVGFKRLVLFLLVCLLSLLLLARADTNAAPRGMTNPAKFAGAFVNWGEVGREHTLKAWEKWLKQPPSSVLGVDFYGQAAWEDFHRPLANWLGLSGAAGSSGRRWPLAGPRYLLATDDVAWAEHEIVAALEAMDCPVEAA